MPVVARGAQRCCCSSSSCTQGYDRQGACHCPFVTGPSGSALGSVTYRILLSALVSLVRFPFAFHVGLSVRPKSLSFATAKTLGFTMVMLSILSGMPSIVSRLMTSVFVRGVIPAASRAPSALRLSRWLRFVLGEVHVPT